MEIDPMNDAANDAVPPIPPPVVRQRRPPRPIPPPPMPPEWSWTDWERSLPREQIPYARQFVNSIIRMAEVARGIIARREAAAAAAQAEQGQQEA